MILQKIMLHPFAGVENRKIDFTGGLNVILGPNEAGKSTVLNALRSVLFTPTKLNKRRFETDIQQFIPLGGDTAGVDLEIIYNKKSFVLKKTWGGTVSSVLKSENGEILTGEDAIQEKMSAMLPAGEGTFRSVLLTHQSGLSGTLSDLKDKHPETIQSMGDILRLAILETDGIPLDKLREVINTKYFDYFSHWDDIEQYPEKGRGINNPYQKEVGFILQAFYEKEKVKLNLQEAEQYESELDVKNKELQKTRKEIEQLADFVNKNKSIINESRERQGLSSELKLLDKELYECKNALKEWPVLESELEKNNKQLPEINNRISKMQEEEKAAKLLEKNKELREKYERVKKLKSIVEKSEKIMNNISELNEEDLDKIIIAEQNVEKLEASLIAGELALKFTAKKEISIDVQEDFSEKKIHNINDKQMIQIKAAGHIVMTHPDWEIEIESGSSNFKKISKELKNAKSKLQDLLLAKNLESLVEAKKQNKLYVSQKNDLQNAINNFNAELGEDSFEKIKTDVEKMGEMKSTRSYLEVAADLLKEEAKNRELNKQRIQLNERIQTYKNAFNNLDKLIEEKIPELTNRKKHIEEKLKTLKTLPQNIHDMDSLVKKFDQAENDLEINREKKNDLLQEISTIMANMPEATVEELTVDLKDKEIALTRQLRRGAAINKIKELSEKMMEEMDSNTYESLEKKLSSYIGMITEKRYKSIRVKNGLPGEIIRDNGKSYNYSYLSDGTRDVVSLALRLSMAEFFLDKSKGFLVMDDPMVDLDPARREKAVEVLKEFARQRQLLFFTCHPEHAKILGGNIIEFGTRV